MSNIGIQITLFHRYEHLMVGLKTALYWVGEFEKFHENIDPKLRAIGCEDALLAISHLMNRILNIRREFSRMYLNNISNNERFSSFITNPIIELDNSLGYLEYHRQLINQILK